MQILIRLFLQEQSDQDLFCLPFHLHLLNTLLLFLRNGYGYLLVLSGQTILISPMLSHPALDKNHMYLIHWLYRKSHIYGF